LDYRVIHETTLFSRPTNRTNLETTLVRVFHTCNLKDNLDFQDGAPSNIVGTPGFGCFVGNFDGPNVDRNNTVLVAEFPMDISLSWILILGVDNIDPNDPQGPLRVVGSCGSPFCVVYINCLLDEINSIRLCSSSSFESQFSVANFVRTPNTKMVLIVRDDSSEIIFPNLISFEHLVSVRRYEDLDVVIYAFSIAAMIGVTNLILGMLAKLLLYFVVK